MGDCGCEHPKFSVGYCYGRWSGLGCGTYGREWNYVTAVLVAHGNTLANKVPEIYKELKEANEMDLAKQRGEAGGRKR